MTRSAAARPTASVVILAWNEWEATRACLEALRPTLSPADEVIVVDNGSTDRTPAALRRFPWVRVITNEANRGFAPGCNQGAAAARGDIVVFLNNDTLPTRRWLDALLEPFADPAVAATGPRSNFVSGAQLVAEACYDRRRRSELREFARSWCERHRGERTEVDRLVGFCLAVRRTDFDAVGGFDEGYEIGGFEDDDLCATLREAGGRLLIVHDSYVHHDGHVTFRANGLDWYDIQQRNEARFHQRHGRVHQARPDVPLVSACLIVKDEAGLLGECLDSLAPVTDEIVVYDTGSTDATIQIATAKGARVIEGYWDDDFGRARNAALAHCRGTWILHVDADERLSMPDIDAVRHALAVADDDTDVFVVDIENLDDDGNVGTEHRAARLFRRVRAEWAGRLHEQVVPRPGQRQLARSRTSLLSIRHLGYTSELLDSRSKADRNVRLAEADLLETPYDDRAALLLNLARSLSGAGRPDEALTRCVEARALRTHSKARPGVLRVGAELLCVLGRPAEALEWIAELRTVNSDSAICDFLEGSAWLQMGEVDRAADLLADVTDAWDDAGLGSAPGVVRARRAYGLVAAERWEPAVELLLEIVAERPGEPAWGHLVRALHRSGQSQDAAARAALASAEGAPARLRALLAQILLTETEAADAFGEAIWSRAPLDPRLVAFAVHLAPHLDVARALEWAARVRAAGLTEHCPLLARARRGEVDPLERLRCAAVAAGTFADERAADVVRTVAARLDPGRFTAALVEFDELAPQLLPTLVAGAAITPSRAAAMADALAALGAADVAAELRAASA